MGHSQWHQFKHYVQQIAGWLGIFTLVSPPAWGQITPTGTTAITTTGSQTQIIGGVQSADGINLFHQFDAFDVPTGQTVTFIGSGSIENILGRVGGGQASTIDGGLAVSNNANLWLLNPAGILFGPNAHLNLQGDFSAATADAVGFEQGWFSDDADYPSLLSAPQSFAFVSNSSHLTNLGNLQVASGRTLRLLGGSVVNGGTLVAPDGNIIVAAVPEANRVNLSQTGQVLTLEIEPWTAQYAEITPIDLPEILTGKGFEQANTLVAEADGTVQLTQTTPAGQAVISGTVSSAGDYGGKIAILGDRLSLVDATVNADGANQGGQIYIGGNYQGQGPLPNAAETWINKATELTASALQQGDGGQIVVWADEATYFSGHAQAHGGQTAGNGGFIEISGKSHLAFDGQFSLGAPQGEAGTILFDPDNILIVDGGTPADIASESPLFPNVIAADNDFGTLTLHAATLESWDGDDNIVLQASNDIRLELGGNNELTFQPGTGSITFIADADNNFFGSFLMTMGGDLIKTSGRDINISGALITLQSIDTHSAMGAGDVTLTAPVLTSIEGGLAAENISITSNELNLNGGNDSIGGTTLLIEPSSLATDINIGPSNNTFFDLDLLETDVLALKDGFTSIAIGRSDGTGTVTLHDLVTDTGTAPFQDPVTILGANILRGPEQTTPWTVTGNNQGNLDSLFGNGLRFENVDSISVSNGTNDTLQGTDGNDTVTFSGVDAGTFNGIMFAGIQAVNGAGGNDNFIFGNGAVISGVIDGGTGNNTLDYSSYITDITVDLETAAASGTGGISNIQQIIAGSGSNIIQGTSGDDVVTLSGLDTGIINDISFQGFETVLPGAGDDRFVVNGGPWVNLDGGAGFDTLDYGASNVGLTLDLENQSANNVAVFANIEGFLGSNHADTLQGTSGNDAISITGNNTGTLGSFTFSGIESINAGAGNDEVAIAAAGSLTGTLEAGTGVDRLDYSSYITDVTIDLENNTATAIGTLSNFEHIVGGSGNNDSLIGTINNDNITLTGIDAGTINAITFKGVENLDGQAGDDTFTVNNGASLTGTLSGGMGNDTANYTPYTTDITVDLQNDAATGISRFDTLESFIGGDGNDTFILNADDPTKEIDGGAGSNTLIGHDVVSIWNLTASNTGNGTGIENFSNIQNLIAGNQSDQINILADNAGFTGRLDGGAGLLKIIGDEINLGTDITGAGELILEPLSTDRDIQLGGVDSPSKLTLSLVELANISADFTAITIGSDKNTGMITLEADVTLPAPAKILAPQGNGIIDTQGFNLTAPELTLSAAQNITAGTLIAPSGITLNSGGAVITQDLLAAAAQNGGNIAIDAGTTITTEQIDTSTTGIKAGDVTLNAADTIQIQTIRAEGNTAGGNVTISTEQFLQVTDRFTNLDGQIASISTAATNGAGDITIHHGGNSNIPFKVGDSSLLGSHSAITSGTFQIEIENSFLNSYTLGNIAILTQDSLPSSIINQSSMVNLSTESTLVAIEPTSVIDFAATDFAVIDFAVIDSLSLDHLRAPTLNDNTNLNEVTASVNINDSNSALFEHLESSFSEQFKSHLNLYERVSISSPSLASAQKTLGNVEEFMDIKPGVLYIYFSPADKQQDASSDLNPNDELGLLLLTHTGQTIRRRVQGVTRSQVMATAEQFYAEVTNSISAPSQYLPPAQQLYSWFIAPVEDELQKQGVQSLAMAMDTGLRTLPVAALHNGQEYLVERYSLGVIPSFSLTDFNPQNFLYAQLENTQLLAMGASQFPSLQVLPAVPEELEIVTDNFHESEVFLNENFTLSNLQAQVARNKYGIVHLASHGVFKPGESRNSYIQLWDQPLQLNQVHTLGLQEANIALMVLSACNTALGDREAEYGFAGLAVNAGVQTSVASLWPISDEGTLGLMTYFYESLQRQPVRAQALQKAQLAMLRGNLQFRGGTLYGLNEEALAHFPELEYHGRWNFEHPFYWSTYTLVGSPW